jgi:CheY-like chemotaxis protein
MDGLTFREHLKSNPELASIPVIGVTAAAAFEADFECLRKPLRFDRLVERIQTTLS